MTVSSAEIDRIMKPEELEQKQQAQRRDSRDRKRASQADTDGRWASPMAITALRRTVRAMSRRRARASSARPSKAAFLHTGPGRYQAPPSYFLIRGDVESRGSQMKPGFVSVITYGNPPTEIPPADGHTSGRRRALAEWLMSPDNPLTARVAVNRIWHHHFGRGIVATLDNFGKMGEKPTHPELLDWLALEFQKRGWSSSRCTGSS